MVQSRRKVAQERSPPLCKRTTIPPKFLLASFERVTFHNEENGFCVLRVKARSHRDMVTAIGHAAAISAGEWLTASGTWHNDRTHGLQFRAKFLKTSAPSTVEGIEKYLSSGMIRGIGPVYAKRLIKAFREKVFEVIETAPERLREVEGIGPLRAQRITAAWAEQKIVREIMLFLHSHGVGTSRAVRIYKTYGNDAIQVMSENPYRLAKDIRGIGFKTADAIAERLGIEKTAMMRVRAGISFALAEAQSDGHCGLPAEDLRSLAEKLLEVPLDLIDTAIALELQDRVLVRDRIEDRDCVFLAGLYQAERATGRAPRTDRARQTRLASNRCRKGDALDREEDRPHPRRKPETSHRACAFLQGARDYGRPRHRQDHDRECDPANPESERRLDAAVCAHRARDANRE